MHSKNNLFYSYFSACANSLRKFEEQLATKARIPLPHS